MTSSLIYAKPGNAYSSAATCHLEDGAFVIRDGNSTVRRVVTGGNILDIAHTCTLPGLELGARGESLRTKWLEVLA